MLRLEAEGVVAFALKKIKADVTELTGGSRLSDQFACNNHILIVVGDAVIHREMPASTLSKDCSNSASSASCVAVACAWAGNGKTPATIAKAIARSHESNECMNTGMFISLDDD